jgi:hypothetical protein
MAFSDQVMLARDGVFRDRVRMAIVTAAKDVMGEAKAVADQVYGKRQALAFQVLRSSESWLDCFAWGVASNPTITGTSTDADIQFTVNSLINDMAGVTGAD